jgi:uncharacterized Ntn-hydrolase superfamily protein
MTLAIPIDADEFWPRGTLMTFSIVARDPDTGDLGVATATAGPFVGWLVPHGAHGVGAVATQAMTNPYLAVDLLQALGDGTIEQALNRALDRDAERERRQIIAVDRTGRAVGWTGSQCEDFAGHVVGDGVAVAGNILAGESVLHEMLSAYSRPGTLGSRLLAALKAGAAVGGDSRGTGSAALKVYGREAYPLLDLRVDASKVPLAELETLLERATSGSYAEFLAAVPGRRAPTAG